MSKENKKVTTMNCPKCGSNETFLNKKSGKLVCKHCKYEYEPVKYEDKVKDLKKLKGTEVSSGAGFIDKKSIELVTLNCPNCGAVSVTSNSEGYTKCHWCHSILTIDENGSSKAPDQILPFKTSKEDALKAMNSFIDGVSKKYNKSFRDNLVPDNVIGVYLPYMLADINDHFVMAGSGEEEYKKVGNNVEVKVYNIEREFDLTIDDIAVEASENISNDFKNRTNYVIRSVAPYDTNDSVKFNGNYLDGFAIEKRDMNIKDTYKDVNSRVTRVAKYAIRDSISQYKQSVRWTKEKITKHGTQWSTAYVPVWLYTYSVPKDKSGKVYYLAVNGRTGRVNGELPLLKESKLKTILICQVISLISALVLAAMISPIEIEVGTYNPVSYIITFIVLYILISIFSTAIGLANEGKESEKNNCYDLDNNYSVSNMIEKDECIRTYVKKVYDSSNNN
jgi:ribosomal protein S27AE